MAVFLPVSISAAGPHECTIKGKSPATCLERLPTSLPESALPHALTHTCAAVPSPSRSRWQCSSTRSAVLDAHCCPAEQASHSAALLSTTSPQHMLPLGHARGGLLKAAPSLPFPCVAQNSCNSSVIINILLTILVRPRMSAAAAPAARFCCSRPPLRKARMPRACEQVVVHGAMPLDWCAQRRSAHTLLPLHLRRAGCQASSTPSGCCCRGARPCDVAAAGHTHACNATKELIRGA